MNEYYVFETQQQALDAEAFISTKAGFPWVGEKRGNPAPQSQQTLRWAIPQQRVTDGKWFFPVVPIAKMLAIFTPPEVQAIITEYNTNYPHTLEFASDNWFVKGF